MWVISRLDIEKERIIELRDRSIEIIQSETQIEKKKIKEKQI